MTEQSRGEEMLGAVTHLRPISAGDSGREDGKKRMF